MPHSSASELLIVGMSLGNPHFTVENIRLTLGEICKDDDARVTIMIPSGPAIHTYKALGYKGTEADRKITKDLNFLKKRVNDVIKILYLDPSLIDILDWNKGVEDHPVYKKRLRFVERLYDECEDFKNSANEETQRVLQNKNKEGELTAESIREGVNYILKEFAYLDAAPKIHGVEKATFLYHRPWPILERYIAGGFDGISKADMGFREIYISPL